MAVISKFVTYMTNIIIYYHVFYYNSLMILTFYIKVQIIQQNNYLLTKIFKIMHLYINVFENDM